MPFTPSGVSQLCDRGGLGCLGLPEVSRVQGVPADPWNGTRHLRLPGLRRSPGFTPGPVRGYGPLTPDSSGARAPYPRIAHPGAPASLAHGNPISAKHQTPFELEEWQSRYEQTVTHNLADSGCHPVGLRELISDDPDAIGRLLDADLHYPPVGGTDALRALSGDWHGAAPGNVLVTVGAAEANAITVASLAGPEDHVIVMEPGYRQVRGCALNAGAAVDAFPLDPERGWRADLDTLNHLVRPDTRLIAVTNPSNPVGTILTEHEMDTIVAAADRAGAWILADEVYRGTERLTDQVTPSFWGRYDKVVCTGSLSKAFGLPGLRLGWLVAPPALVEATWRRHEYATISASKLSMLLAETALTPATRDRLLARNRTLIRDGYARLQRWIDDSGGLLSVTPPQATALAFVRYHLPRPSLEIAHALREQGSVLVGAGVHFGIEHHLRITHGLEPGYLDAALASITRVLALPSRSRALGGGGRLGDDG